MVCAKQKNKTRAKPISVTLCNQGMYKLGASRGKQVRLRCTCSGAIYIKVLNCSFPLISD